MSQQFSSKGILRLPEKGRLLFIEATRLHRKPTKIMQSYLFYIETKPKTDTLRAHHLCGAMASIWVFDKSKASAQEKAFSYINDYGWDVVKVEHSFLPTPEYIASLDEPEAQTYRKSEMNGISAQFDVLPKEPRQGWTIAHDTTINKNLENQKFILFSNNVGLD